MNRQQVNVNTTNVFAVIIQHSAVINILMIVLFLIGCSESESPGAQSLSVSEKSEVEDRIANKANEIGTAVLLIQKGGQVVFSFGDISKKYMCHSIRKPLLGGLYGIYQERGIIDIELTLADLEIDDIEPSLTQEEQQANIQDLLLSRSGVYHEAGGEVHAMIDARPQRGSHEPGTYFYYNNWDFNALGTIFRMRTGEDIFKAFDNEIAKPIGMKDFVPSDGTYVVEENRSIHPSYFFRMSSRDLALFGELYINGGAWNGQQIVPIAWIDESTLIRPVENPGGDPYGYLWRIVPDEIGYGHAYYHTGLGVHLLFVIPDHSLVIVHRVDTDIPFDIKWYEIKQLIEYAVTELNLLNNGSSSGSLSK
ncbi:MAG: serine hydrolase [Desulfobacteraceae bacterium]|nr:serine hydrolase [Desulfobacteraceae bacterium]